MRKLFCSVKLNGFGMGIKKEFDKNHYDTKTVSPYRFFFNKIVKDS